MHPYLSREEQEMIVEILAAGDSKPTTWKQEKKGNFSLLSGSLGSSYPISRTGTKKGVLKFYFGDSSSALFQSLMGMRKMQF